MTYNQAAQWIQLPEDPTAASMKIRTIHSGGSTSFKSVFEMVGSYLETGSTEKSGIVRGIKNLMKSATGSSKYEQKRKVFAFFLTDGQDTCSKTGELMRSKDNLQKRMAEYGEEVGSAILVAKAPQK